MTNIENIPALGIDDDDDDIVHYIEITENSNGELTWDSSYETLDEFLEVIHIVLEEAQEPVLEVHTLH